MTAPRQLAHWRALVALALSAALATLARPPSVLAAEPGSSVAVAPAAQTAADDVAQRVVDLTNQERAKAGLPPLTLDPALSSAALAHSQDMADHDYFSHTGSDGSTVDQRIKAAGYSPLWAYGENIAAGQPTPEDVVSAWMSSAGHRANILNSGYEHIGVGYVYAAGTPYGYYWTEDLASHGPAALPTTSVPPSPTPVSPTATPAPPTATPLPPTPLPPTAMPIAPTPMPPTAMPIAPTPMPPTAPAPVRLPTRVPQAAVPTPTWPTPAAASPPAPTLAASRIWQVVQRVNEVRAGAGLAPLVLDPALLQEAQAHSVDMAQLGTLAHTGSDGSIYAERAMRAGYALGAAIAENIACGQATAGEAVSAWMASPTLRDNILNPGLSRIGVGYAYGPRGPFGHYWTLDLASHSAATSTLVSPVPVRPPSQAGRYFTGVLQQFVRSMVR